MNRYPNPLNPQIIHLATTSDLRYDQRLQRICESLRLAGYELRTLSRNKYGGSDHPEGGIRIKTWFRRSFLFYLEYNLRLIKHLLFQKTGILYSSDSDTLPACMLVAFLRRKKMIYDAHEYFEQSPEIVHKPFVRFVWHRVTLLGVRQADLCITVSDSLAAELEKRYGKKFLTIRNLPVRKQDCSAARTDRLIWYQGVLNVGRGLEEMIRLMPELPGYRLAIAGEGDLSEKLRSLVQELQLEDRVKFLGWLSADRLHEEACRAWIGLNLLSADNKNYLHSLANKSFDYVQACLPALHMDFPEYRALVSQYACGLLLKDLSGASILNAIRQLEDPAVYNHLQEQCKTARQVWCWEREAKWLVEGVASLNA